MNFSRNSQERLASHTENNMSDQNTHFDNNIERDFQQRLFENCKVVDKWFACLLVLQWIVAIVAAIVCSPYAWQGAVATTHSHVWLAVFLGGALALIPLFLSWQNPGQRSTRLVIASAQVLFSSLLIHLSAGRIETHFHVFVSMALLVAYRDKTVFLPAVLITATDHLLRGFWWPQSVFGQSTFELLQPFEHAVWLLLETIGLCFIAQENRRQWHQTSQLQNQLRNERNHFEERVEERTRQLANLKQFREEILNSIDASVCILDMRGRIIFTNQRWNQLALEHGETTQCTLGSNYLSDCVLARLGTPEFVSMVAANVRLVACGESESFCSEYSVDVKNNIRDYQLSITPMAMDGELGVTIVHVDVTRLKRTEKRATALAKLVLESPDEVLIASAESNNFLEANDGVTKNTGYSRTAMLSMGVFDLFCGQHGNSLRDAMLRIESGAESVARIECTIQRVDGSEYPCRVSLHRTLFEEHEVWVLFISDLSGQKELELKLQQAQKLESLGTLAAGIAHEINTPMQCVVGNFEFLQSSFSKLTALSDRLVEMLDSSSVDWSNEREQLQELRVEYKYDFLRKQTPMALEEAADSSRRIVSIVRAMKAMSHPGTEDAVETDVHELIENASTISRNRWKYVSDMQLNFSADVPKVFAFPSELSQVFVNLMVNSADAILERLGADPAVLGLIAIDTSVKEDKVVISVRDTGNGIPPANLKKIFDPFFTTKNVGKGTGQGLAITHAAIVQKHHGSISVSSEVGIGTVFKIELPINRNRTRPNVITPAIINTKICPILSSSNSSSKGI